MMNPNQSQAENLLSNPKSAERKKLTTRQKGALLMAGVSMLTVLGTGCNAKSPDINTPTTSEKPMKQKIPKGAEDFVSEYSDVYDNPIATWYAQEAYTSQTGTNLVLSEAEITSELKSTEIFYGGESALGFEMYKLPLNTELNEVQSSEIFNTYTTVELSRYMNYLAKNPSTEGLALIDREFMNYCSNRVGNNLNTLDDDSDLITAMMETAKEIVSKHGSSSNYTVTPGKLGESKSDSSTYFKPDSFTPTFIDDDNIITQASGKADVVIQIDTYDEKGFAVRSYETINDMIIYICRRPQLYTDLDIHDDFSYITVGQFKP